MATEGKEKWQRKNMRVTSYVGLIMVCREIAYRGDAVSVQGQPNRSVTGIDFYKMPRYAYHTYCSTMASQVTRAWHIVLT
jgi:hypothetical protein